MLGAQKLIVTNSKNELSNIDGTNKIKPPYKVSTLFQRIK